MERLSKIYKESIIPELKKDLNKSNIFALPRIEKVVVSIGVGDFKEDKGAVERVANELAKITSQKPKTNLSRKAVSAFKLRIGQPVGLTVTLRGEKMFDFLNRFVNIALPQVRDFRGLSTKSFDGQGNYSVGLKDYTIFPEIKYEEVAENFGLEINIRVKSQTKDDAKVLLTKLGFPFKKEEK